MSIYRVSRVIMNPTGSVIIFLSLAASAQGQAWCNWNCIDLWSPVCGTDGVTYTNPCELELADCLSEEEIDLDHAGPCETGCDLDCMDGWDPSCGTDGLTYSNSCARLRASCLINEEIDEDYKGECQPPTQDQPAVCPDDFLNADCSPAVYSPVCELTTKLTFSSLCDLCHAELKAQQAGENIIYVIHHLGPC